MNKLKLTVLEVIIFMLFIGLACNKKSPTEGENIQNTISSMVDIANFASEKYEEFTASYSESQARQLLVNELKYIPAVINAGISADSTTVWWRLGNGAECGFLTETMFSLAKNQSDTVEFSALKNQLLIKESVVNTNALLLSPFQWQLTSSYEMTSIKNLFLGMDFQVNYKNNDEIGEDGITFQDFKNFTDYGAIYIVTHGYVNSENNVLLNSGIDIGNIDESDWNEFTEGINNNYFEFTSVRSITGKLYLSFTPKWIQSLYSEGLESTLIFGNACESLFNSTMANAMIGAAANPTSTYFGWTQKVKKNDSNETAAYFFNQLLNDGLNCGDAWQQLRDHQLGISSPALFPKAYFEYQGDSKLKLIDIVETNLTVSESTLNLGSSSGSNGSFNVTSNTSWSVSDNASWLNCTPSNGSNNGTVTVTASSENTSTDSRTATVAVSGDGITRNVTITQSGTGDHLTVSKSMMNLGSASGSSGSFDVTSNISWSVSDNASWLNCSPQNGSDNGTVTVSASSENTSESLRTAIVTVSGSGINRNITVTQSGTGDYLTVSTSTINLGSASGSSGSFDVTSNISWSVSDEASWLSCSPESGSYNGKVTITASSENTSTDSRTATITVSGGGITCNITVTQSEAETELTVSESTVNLGSDSGSSGSFDVTSNISWSVSDDASWLNCSPQNGFDNGTVTVTAGSENSSTDPRTATVTVSGSGITCNLTVTQSGAADNLTVSETAVNLGSSSGSSGSFNVTSNISWSVSDNASWLNCSPEDGSYNGKVTVTAGSENSSTDPRTATVTVSGEGITRNVTVTQVGADKELTVSKSSVNIASFSGSSGSFNVTSNISWSVSDNKSWLNCSPLNGSDNETVTVTAGSANSSTDSRMATVTVSGEGITRYITVTQSGVDEELTVSKSTVNLGSTSGSSGSFNVTSNISWSVSDNKSWLNCSPLNGSDNETVTVTASSANTSADSRTATVTVSGEGIARYVTVVQEGANIDPNILIDQDGNEYSVVKIGNQWWMAEDLRVTHYRNGDEIPDVTNNSSWNSKTTGATCSYNNNSNLAKIYGRLYNWYAVNDNRNIAPEGWRVPTDDDWKELSMALGMSPSEANGTHWQGTDEGKKLKETGLSHWIDPNIASNTSGFTARGCGYREVTGEYNNMAVDVHYWTTTMEDADNAWYRVLYYNLGGIRRASNDRRYGFSVRLVKETSLP